MPVKQEEIKEQQRWHQRHPLWWRLIIGVLIVCSVTFVAIGALFAFINTPIGKNYIAAQIQKHTHDHIQVQGITGFLPNHINITEIQFKNADVGVWLDIKQAQLNWSPWALLWGKFSAYSLIVKEINFNALPPKQGQVGLSQDEGQIVNRSLKVDIQHIKIDQLFISEKIAKKNINITVDGQVKIRNVFNIMNIDTLKAAFMTRPKLRLFENKQDADFQFGGKISASMERKDGTDYKALFIPLRFSIILPQTDKSLNKLHIYLGLGDKL